MKVLHVSPTDLLAAVYQKLMKAWHKASEHNVLSQRGLRRQWPLPLQVHSRILHVCFSCLLQNPIFLSRVPLNPGRLTYFLSSFIYAVIAPALSINTRAEKPGRPHSEQLYSTEAISSISPQLSY